MELVQAQNFYRMARMYIMKPISFMVEMQMRAAKRSAVKIEEELRRISEEYNPQMQKKALDMFTGSRATKYRKLKKFRERNALNGNS